MGIKYLSISIILLLCSASIYSEDCKSPIHFFDEDRYLPCDCVIYPRASVMSKFSSLSYSCEKGRLMFSQLNALLEHLDKNSINYDDRTITREDGLKETVVKANELKNFKHENFNKLKTKYICNHELCVSIISSDDNILMNYSIF